MKLLTPRLHARGTPRPHLPSDIALEGTLEMPRAWSAKDERQYTHVRKSERRAGRSSRKAAQIAAATVNKTRRRRGRTKQT